MKKLKEVLAFLAEEEYSLTIDGLRISGAAEQLGDEIVAWRGRAPLYALSADCYLLVVRTDKVKGRAV